MVGKTLSSGIFLYTLGDANPQFFLTEPEMTYVEDLNDAGTFCGSAYIPRNKKIPAHYAPFRYNSGWAEPLEVLPDNGNTRQMNNSGDIVFTKGDIYRDDWSDSFTNVDDLVVGTTEDLALWFSGTVELADINDRAGPSNSGQIAGRLFMSTGDVYMYVLTPEPAPEPPQ